MKTLVLGLGNEILRDDGVGIAVVREMGRRVNRPGLDFEVASVSGLNVLDLVSGYDKVIVVDSIRTGRGAPGDLYSFGLEELEGTGCMSSPHAVNFAAAFELGRMLGLAMPGVVRIYAVEVEDNTTFGEDLSEGVLRELPRIVNHIIEREFEEGAYEGEHIEQQGPAERFHKEG